MSTKEDEELQMKLAVLVGQGTELTFYDTKMLIRLIKSYASQKALEELELASRVNEQKELDPVINPHVPYRMRAWFKDRIAALKQESEQS